MDRIVHLTVRQLIAIIQMMRSILIAPAEIAYWLTHRIGAITILIELLWFAKFKPWSNSWIRFRLQTFLNRKPPADLSGFLKFLYANRTRMWRYALWASSCRWGLLDHQKLGLAGIQTTGGEEG